MILHRFLCSYIISRSNNSERMKERSFVQIFCKNSICLVINRCTENVSVRQFKVHSTRKQRSKYFMWFIYLNAVLPIQGCQEWVVLAISRRKSCIQVRLHVHLRIGFTIQNMFLYIYVYHVNTTYRTLHNAQCVGSAGYRRYVVCTNIESVVPY